MERSDENLNKFNCREYSPIHFEYVDLNLLFNIEYYGMYILYE